MEPDLEGLLPTETSGLTTGERRRLTARHQNSASFSWTRTDVRYIQHSHDWLIRGFSQTDCRYLETSFSMKDPSSMSPVFVDPIINHSYKIRLHPQGNKQSNLEFTFFQIFSVAQNAKFKARFYVYNSRNEELQTTVYSGAQQLNGFFQYVRRSELLKHIETDDELRLSVLVTTYSDTVMRQGSYPKRNVEVNYPDMQLSRDFESAFNNDRFSDFKIVIGQRTLNVHKVILASRSEYFSALLAPHTKESIEGKLEFTDVDYEVFSEMIYYMYTGKSPRIRSMSLELIAMADRFQVTKLKDDAVRVLKENLRIDTVCEAAIKAEMHAAEELKEAAIDFIVQNSATVLKTSQWELLLQHPKLVTEVCQAMSSESSKQAPFSEPLAKRVRMG